MHNIATVNGQSAFTYLDAPPWHGLGKRLTLQGVARDRMIDAALAAAALNFTVGSVPLYLSDGTPVQGFKASVRFGADGTIAEQLSVVGDGYTHSQNSRNVDIARELVSDRFGFVPAAAGALGKGERCWMLLRAADSKITVLDGDDVNGYFLMHWGHDGNISLQGLGTPVRVVCQNTLSMATSGQKSWFTIRHTSSIDARIDQAAKLVAKLAEAMKQTGDTFASMARKRLSAKQIVAYIDSVIPNTSASATVSPKIVARRDTIAQLVHNGKGAAMANQAVDTSDGSASLWAVYNAVTEYMDHVRTAEATNASGLLRAQESAIFGGNAEIKAGALATARQLLAA